MDGVSGICVGLIVTALILFLIVRFFDQKYVRELRSMSFAEIEKRVFRYETEYFILIGEDNESVQEFRQAIEAKDLLAINKNWSRLRADFIALERKAQHNDRPLIMDYYYAYELELRELQKRTKA